jgi:hypothetical protein
VQGFSIPRLEWILRATSHEFFIAVFSYKSSQQVYFLFSIIIKKMNSFSQLTRPALSAVSKRSMVRTFASSRAHKEVQLEKSHHQVAPLTDSTLYAPQGQVSTSASTSAEETTVFTPSVNAVFDD